MRRLASTPHPIPLCLFVLLSCAGHAHADETVTATGRAFCFDGASGAYLPLAGARVELVDSDCDGSQICDQEMGRDHVKADGSLTVTGSGGDILGGRPDVYVRFAYNDDQGVRLTDELDHTRSWSTPEHEHNNFGGGTIEFGDWVTGVGAAPGEGSQCRVWQEARQSFQNYVTGAGVQPPAGHLDVEYWSAIFSGTPWTNTDTVHWPVGYGHRSMRHEFGHSVRHAADGGKDHFNLDVVRYQYARTHGRCAVDGNRNPSEMDSSLAAFAFNEGWAEYWAGDTGGCGSDVPVDDMHEGIVARQLLLLQNANGLSRKDMAQVLIANPGSIHSLTEFKNKLAATGATSSASYSLSQEGEPLPAAYNQAQRQEIIRHQIATVQRSIEQLTAKKKRYATLSTQAPAAGGDPRTRVPTSRAPCTQHDCDLLFQRLVNPAIIDGQIGVLKRRVSLLETAASAAWAKEVNRQQQAGTFEAWSDRYRAEQGKAESSILLQSLSAAERSVNEAKSQVQPFVFEAFVSELARARQRLTQSGASGTTADGVFPEVRLPVDEGRPRRQ